jgi:surface protein
MSGRYVRAGGVAVDLGGGDAGPEPYVRPADWVALPTVLSSDQKFVGLHAVYDHESNFVAVNCAGAYTVDWGDGVTENFATGVQANHNFLYANLSSGTLSTRGYRQAVVTITPQAGQNLTTVNLFIKHNQSGLASNGYSTGWLDIRMAGSLISTLTIGGASTSVVRHRMLEQFEYVGTSAVVTCANKFQNCVQLRSLIGTAWTSSVTNMTSMFSSCSSLQTVPLFNTGAVTNMTSMFSSCASLQTVPLFSTGTVTLMTSMFDSCFSLQTVPLFSTGAVTDVSSMFASCFALATVPLFNTASVTNMSSMFNSCTSLQMVPLFSTGAVTNMTSMFNGCSSLQMVPLLNTSGVILDANIGSIFTGCSSLRIGALSGTKVTISYLNCLLGPAALDAIYTNLASGVVSKTITVTGNWGVATDTPSIATAKGWTVTG